MTSEPPPEAQNTTSHPLGTLESYWLALLRHPEPRSSSATSEFLEAAQKIDDAHVTRRARTSLAFLGLSAPGNLPASGDSSALGQSDGILAEVAGRLAPYLQAFGEGNPEIPVASEIDDSDGGFCCGSALLVAPILHGHACTRMVQLPEGRWFRFPSGEAVPNRRRHIAVLAQAHEIPVFVRAGSIVPLRGTTEDPSDPRAATVHVYGRGDGRFALCRPGEADSWKFTLRTEAMHLNLDINSEAEPTTGSLDFVICALHAITKAPDALSLNGMAVPPRGSEVRSRSDVPGWHYDHATATITIGVSRVDLPARITTSQPPVRTKPAVLDAKETTRFTWPSRGFARVATDTFAIATPGFDRKPMEARVAASWQSDGLCLYGEIDHRGSPAPTDLRATEEDGFVFLFKLAVGPNPIVVSYRITPLGAGAKAMIRSTDSWNPHPHLIPTWTRDGSIERCQLFIPSQVLGPAALIPGISCPFDWWVQRTDDLGRRGILEWQEGACSGEDPAGTIALG